MWSVGGLQVHDICNHRVMYGEVVEAIRNLTGGDLKILLVVIQLGLTRLKKTWTCFVE